MYAPDMNKCPNYLDKQEYVQECWLAKLSDDSLSDDEISDIAIKKLKKEKSFDFKKAPHLYNEEGECLDDNYYFVDPSTVEQFGEGRRITDAQFTEGKKLARTWYLANTMCCKTMLARAKADDKSLLKRVFIGYFKPMDTLIRYYRYRKTLSYMVNKGSGAISSSLHWLKKAKRFQNG